MPGPDVTPIRSPIDVDGLEKYLSNANVPDSLTTLGSETKWPPAGIQGPVNVQQFKFGQLNPTYYIKDSNGKEFVLRRKPSPNAKLVLKLAHAVEREFFMLRGIDICNKRSSKKVPVPNVHLLCEDESVIGFVFYLMEYVEGRLIKNPEMPEIPAEQQETYWTTIMDTITAIHSIDSDLLVEQLPAKHFPQFQPDRLQQLSKSSYFQRQLKTLSAVSKGQLQTVDPIPHLEQIVNWISTKAPGDPDNLTLIHGDCKIDNFLFHPTESRVVAVLDWELCTFGHPIFDLANFLQPFQIPQALNLMFYYPEITTIGIEKEGATEFLNERLRLYQTRLGHPWSKTDPKNNPIDSWRVGYVFGLFRLCVISQGIGMRIKKGSASSAQAESFGSMYEHLAELALEYMEHGGTLKL